MYTKFLGIDWGSKKIGLSISNIDKTIAFPFASIANDDKVIEKIRNIVTEHCVTDIFIGIPLDKEGNFTENCQKVQDFGDKIAEFVLKVHYIDERMTTQIANVGQIYSGSLGKQSFRAYRTKSSGKVSIRSKDGTRSKVSLNKVDFNDDSSSACYILSTGIELYKRENII